MGQGRVGSAPSPLGEGGVGSPYYRAFLAKLALSWQVELAETLSKGAPAHERRREASPERSVGGRRLFFLVFCQSRQGAKVVNHVPALHALSHWRFCCGSFLRSFPGQVSQHCAHREQNDVQDEG